MKSRKEVLSWEQGYVGMVAAHQEMGHAFFCATSQHRTQRPPLHTVWVYGTVLLSIIQKDLRKN